VVGDEELSARFSPVAERTGRAQAMRFGCREFEEEWRYVTWKEECAIGRKGSEIADMAMPAPTLFDGTEGSER